jgi:CRP-like cAMP-binding protein
LRPNQTLDLLIGTVRKAIAFPKTQMILIQRRVADSVFRIGEEKVTLTVVSRRAKETIVGLLNDGDSFGEGSLGRQAFLHEVCTAMTRCRLLRIDKQEMAIVFCRTGAWFTSKCCSQGLAGC